jgi:hypothetical protein
LLLGADLMSREQKLARLHRMPVVSESDIRLQLIRSEAGRRVEDRGRRGAAVELAIIKGATGRTADDPINDAIDRVTLTKDF